MRHTHSPEPLPVAPAPLSSYEMRLPLGERVRSFMVAVLDATRQLVDGYGSVALPSDYVIPQPVHPERDPYILQGSKVSISSRDGVTGELHRVKPGERCRAVGRAPWTAFLPEHLTIHGNASKWIVHDIKIGNRSQMDVVSSDGDGIPGDVFASGALDGMLKFETAQTAMDITFEVTYRGDRAEGEVFDCTLRGQAAL